MSPVERVVQVSLNGSRDPETHPKLKLTLKDLTEDVRRCASLGCRSFHVHPRTLGGAESLDATTVDYWMERLRVAAPEASFSVSTGAWIGSCASRLAAIRSWWSRPDYASVNFHEEGAEEIADALLRRGVGVEAGIWHPEGARRFLAFPLRRFCRRLMLEMPDAEAWEAEGVLKETLRVLEGSMGEHEIILHGEGKSAWPMLQLALLWGWRTRIGLEDSLHLPDGRPAHDNLALFSAALSKPGSDSVAC